METMELTAYMNFLKGLYKAKKRFEESCCVFAEIECTEDIWSLSAYRSTADKLNDSPCYVQDFSDPAKLMRHMETLTSGAKLANGEEV